MSAHRKKISRATRQTVYERDDWTCQGCGLHIPPNSLNEARGRNAPMLIRAAFDYVWLELDHVVPLALGGGNEATNLRALCSPCNRSKSKSTSHAPWELRIAVALQILTSRQATETTARMAAAALLGQREET